MQRRRFLVAAGTAPLLALPAAAPAPQPAVIEEWTFLQSLAEEPAALVAFLEANWFAMDRIARARGLISHYRLRTGAGPDWNVVVIVGYPQAAGYDGIRADFDAIRAAHRPVGGPLASLGRIVASRRLAVAGGSD